MSAGATFSLARHVSVSPPRLALIPRAHTRQFVNVVKRLVCVKGMMKGTIGRQT